jgi:hypothetical protein
MNLHSAKDLWPFLCLLILMVNKVIDLEVGLEVDRALIHPAVLAMFSIQSLNENE